jgi:hypothetical protein
MDIFQTCPIYYTEILLGIISSIVALFVRASTSLTQINCGLIDFTDRMARPNEAKRRLIQNLGSICLVEKKRKRRLAWCGEAIMPTKIDHCFDALWHWKIWVAPSGQHFESCSVTSCGSHKPDKMISPSESESRHYLNWSITNLRALPALQRCCATE